MGKLKRPVAERARRGQYRLRTNADEEEKLEYLSMKMGLPKSEVLRKALEMYYNLAKYQD